MGRGHLNEGGEASIRSANGRAEADVNEEATEILYGSLRVHPSASPVQINLKLGRRQYLTLAILIKRSDMDRRQKTMSLKTHVGTYSVYRPVLDRLIAKGFIDANTLEVNREGVEAAITHELQNPTHIKPMFRVRKLNR